MGSSDCLRQARYASLLLVFFNSTNQRQDLTGYRFSKGSQEVLEKFEIVFSGSQTYQIWNLLKGFRNQFQRTINLFLRNTHSLSSFARSLALYFFQSVNFRIQFLQLLLILILTVGQQRILFAPFGQEHLQPTLTYRARRTLRFEQPLLVGAVTLSPFTLSLNNANSSSQSNDRVELYRLSFLTLPVRDELSSIFFHECFQSVAFNNVISHPSAKGQTVSCSYTSTISGQWRWFVPAEHSVFRLSPDVTGSRINGPLQVAIRVSMDAINAPSNLFSRR